MRYLTFLLTLFVVLEANAQKDFNSCFHDKTLRIDYTHGGTDDSDFYALDALWEEPYWGGSKVNLIDTLRYGHYYFKVYDHKSHELLYSRGYSTLFKEWQTTKEAKKLTKAFSETVVMPYPKKKVDVVFYGRDKQNAFVKKFDITVDPDSYFIRPHQRKQYPSFEVLKSGDPAGKVDVVILPEGYTKEEMGLFIADCKKFAEELFLFHPYSENKDRFNIYGVLAPSKESGSDIPAEGIYKSTIMNSSFYTFDSERYCMTTDNKSVRDLAANAPYDQIYVLINTDKYGGGAIYNHYNMSVNSNRLSAEIFVHEFGHGFAGLGDEYYNSSVAYSDFYPLDAEPWEPNITTLVNFNGKWESMIPDSVPIPTPNKVKYADTLGVFEGGGYVAKGVYRPSYDCLMNTLQDDKFCGACKKAIQQMIDFYSE